MKGLKRFLYKFRNFVRPGRAEEDLAREVGSHLEFLEEDFQSRGMTGAEARRAARRAYGGIEQAKELQREARSWFWLEQVRQDIRFSVRGLRKSPGFALTAVLTLALGIGANAAIFSLIDAVMLKMLPVRHAEELLEVRMAGEDIWGMEEPFVNNPLWEELRDRQDVFAGLSSYGIARFDLAGRGEARYVQGNYVSGTFFDTLGLNAMVGRVITKADDRRGCRGTAVLSYGFWRSEYGGRSDVAGRTMKLDNHVFEILGVIGPGFSGVDVGRKSEIYVPICAESIIGGSNGVLDGRRGGWLSVIGRPKAGVSLKQIEARLKMLAGPSMQATVPLDVKPSQQKTYLKRTFAVQTAATGLSSIRSKYGQALNVLMAIVGTVLLIACVNVANLLLARGAARQREMAIRMALGSGRGRLMRQLLIESLLLSTGGALLGIVFARWAARLLVGFLASNVYRENEVFLDLSIDWRVLAFTIGVAMVTALLFGLAPTWRATRVDPQAAMKANGRGVMQGGRFTLGKALVAAQVALSLVLVGGAGLLLATFVALETLDPGFERGPVLLMDVDLGEAENSPAERGLVFARALEQLRRQPGVRSASESADTPLGGAVDASYLQIDGRASAERELVFMNEISDGYFETLGTPLLAGRDFNGHDTRDSQKVAIVSEGFAQKYAPGRNPIGLRYRAERGNQLGDPVEIVGLVRDAKYLDLRENFHPTVYIAQSQNAKPGKMVTFELRATAGHPTSLIQESKRSMGAIYGNASLQFRTLAGQVDESLARERLLAALAGFFGGLALLLAVLGLYGVVSYNMARQRREIGIRMAFGAQQSRVVLWVLEEVAMLIGIGVTVGLAVTMGVTRLMSSLLYGVKANDVRTLFPAVAILALVAIAAGFVPARRASRLDPMEALREE